MGAAKNGKFFAALFGAFMRGNKPLVLPGVKEGFSKDKKGELKASPKNLPIYQAS